MTELVSAITIFEESSSNSDPANQPILYRSVFPTDPIYVFACGMVMDIMSELLKDAYRINVIAQKEECNDPIHLRKSLLLGNLPEEKDPYIFIKFVLSDVLQDMRKSGRGHNGLIDFLKAYNSASPDENPIPIQLEEDGFRLSIKSGRTQSLLSIYDTLFQIKLRHPHVEESLENSFDCCSVIIERLRGGPKGRIPAHKMN